MLCLHKVVRPDLSARLSSSCYDAVVVEEALLSVMVAALVYN